MMFASENKAHQTRIGPLDSHGVQHGRLAWPGGRRGALEETPGLLEGPAAKLRRRQSPRRIDASRCPSLGAVNRAAKKPFAGPFAILENATLSVRSNILDLADV